MTNKPHILKSDLREVTARNENARAIIDGFSTALPTLARFWRQVHTALADTPILIVELMSIRLDHANLIAAGQASMTAYHEGEDDPLFYLRDELNAQGQRRRA